MSKYLSPLFCLFSKRTINKHMKPILEVCKLKTYFSVKKGIFSKRTGWVYAVDDLSFSIQKGNTLGLVGESGCGKTTVGRTIIGLYKAFSGNVFFDGKNISELKRKELRKARRDMHMIFQDPYESLNIRHTVHDILEEPFSIHKIGNTTARKKDIRRLLEKVGLSTNATNRFPHEFSGGQRQRIGIARAIALQPKMIICDEPVSALDVSVQSQILNLLLELQKEMGLTYLFISHDLAVVRHVSDFVAVMYLGKIVEKTDADTIYTSPLHPYTKALISAVPVCDPKKKSKKKILEGSIPSPITPPSGCRFHTRCPDVTDICKKTEPELKEASGAKQHLVACHNISLSKKS